MLRSTRVERTEPSTEPVTAETLRNHLRVDDKSTDRELDVLITTARQVVEQLYLWKLLIDQTVVEYFDLFANGMELSWGPVDSVTSVQYIDVDGDTQTLSTDIYELAFKNGAGIVRLKFNQVFPSTQIHKDVVWITYVAGYGSADDVPKAIQQAILLYAGGLYDGDIPLPAIDSLLSSYADGRVL